MGSSIDGRPKHPSAGSLAVSELQNHQPSEYRKPPLSQQRHPPMSRYHRNFDDHNNSGFVFIPIDSGYFKDLRSGRLCVAYNINAISKTSGKGICPTNEGYRQHQLGLGVITAAHNSVLCKRYTTQNYFPKRRCCSVSTNDRLGQSYLPAPWCGDAMAALR